MSISIESLVNLLYGYQKGLRTIDINHKSEKEGVNWPLIVKKVFKVYRQQNTRK